MSRFVEFVIKDKDRKPLIQLGAELVIGALKEKEKPFYYLQYLLYKKERKNFKNYLGRKNLAKIRAGLFHTFDTPEIDDKLLFSEIMKKNNLPSPLTKKISSDGKFYVQNTLQELSKEDFKLLLNELVEESSNKSIFIKPVDSNGGKNCFKIYKETIGNDEDMDLLFDLLKKDKFIFQETIEQHPMINKIYPDSINTIRVYSHYDRKENKVDIISAFMRFGKDGMKVDNGSSGGLYVNIDLDKWCLDGKALTYYENGGQVFEKHPNSNIKFDNYTLIFKEELYDTIDKGARLFINKVIGWDIALTPNGVTIVEANKNPSLLMAQVACGGFRGHEGFMKIFEEYIN